MTATSAAPTAPPRSAVPWVLAAVAAAATSAAASMTVAIVGAGAAHLLEWYIVGALIAFGIPLALRDFSAHQLPDLLVWPLYGVIGALVAVCGVLEADLGRAGIALLIGALMWGLYFVMGLFGASSYGDVKLAGALGLALGWWASCPHCSAPRWPTSSPSRTHSPDPSATAAAATEPARGSRSART